MVTLSPQMPVRDIAIECPAAIPVLENFLIDYCCRGQHTLAEACFELDLDAGSVIREIDRHRKQHHTTDCVWRNARLGELLDHIAEKHHSFAREHLHLIGELLTKVERRHGATHPEVFLVSTAMAEIGPEVASHISFEETVVFPSITRLEQTERSGPAANFADLEGSIAEAKAGHDRMGHQLHLLRKTTEGYRPPADACTTFQALYRALEVLDSDLHRHIHLEDNILYPRVLALAKMEL